MNLAVPIIAVIFCLGWGICVKRRMRCHEKVLSAAYDLVCQMQYALRSEMLGTPELLEKAAKSDAGKVLTCFQAVLTAVDAGEDLYAAWERECAAFGAEKRLSETDAALIQKTVLLLGNLDYLGVCDAYAELAQALKQRKEYASEQNRVHGDASVKIGLLCGLGVGLLLWRP